MPLISLVCFALGVLGLLSVLTARHRPNPQRPVEPAPVPEPEVLPWDGLATPYREALDAAFRIQQAAWLAEQHIHAEAIRHASDDPWDASLSLLNGDGQDRA